MKKTNKEPDKGKGKVSLQTEDAQATLFGTLLQSYRQAIVIIDSRGVMIVVSQSACEMFGYEEDYLLGKNVTEIMPERFAPDHTSFIQAYLQTGIKKVIGMQRVIPALRVGEEEFPVQIALSEMVIDDEHYFCSILTDVTERVREEERLALSEEKAKSITDVVRDGIVTCNFKGIINGMNSSAEAMFGIEREDAIGQNVKVFMHDEDAKVHDEMLARYRQTGKKVRIDHLTAIRAKRMDGEEFQAEIRVTEGLVSGSVVYMAHIHECTTQILEEEQAKNHETTMEHIIDSIADGIVTIDEYGIIQYANRAALSMFQFQSEHAMLKRNVKILMPNPYRDDHDLYLEAYRRTGEAKVIGQKRGRDVQGIRTDHTVFPLRITITEVYVGGVRLFSATLHDTTEQKKKFEAICKSEDKIRGLIENNADCIVTINERGEVDAMNDAGLQMFGYTLSYLRGKNVSILAPEPYRSEHDEYLEAYLRTGVRKVIGLSRAAEVAAIRKNGETFPIEIAVSEAVVGSQRYFTAIIRDITDRILRETELKRSEERVRSFFDTAADGMMSIDEYGVVVAANKSVTRVFQFEASEIIGNNVSMLMPSPYREEHDSYVRRYATTRKATVMGMGAQEVTGMRKDGSVFPLQLTLSEAIVGSQTLYTGILRDITDRKIQEEELRAAEEKVKAILDTACDGVVVMDPSGIIETFNAAAETMWGYASHEVIGKNVNMLMPEPYASNHDSYLNAYAMTGERKVIGFNRQVSACRKSGEVFPVEIGVAEVHAGSRKVFTGIVRDILAKVQLEEELAKRENRLRGVIESASDGVVVIDDMGEIMSFNHAAEKMFDRLEPDTTGQNVRILMPSPYDSQHDGYLKAYRTTGIRKIIGNTRELIARRSDSSVFPVEVSVSESIVGSTRQFTGIIRDITERKHAEEKLRKSEERMKLMMENAIDGVISIDETGTVVAANPAANKIFGYSRGDLDGENVNILMGEPHRGKHNSYIKRYVQTGIRHILGKKMNEVRGLKRDNTEFDLALSVSESTVGSSRVFTGIVRDITEAKQNEMRVKAREEKVRSLFDEALKGVIVTDNVGTIQEVNAYLCKVLEYTPTELIGQNVSILMPSHIAEVHTQFMEAYTESGIARRSGKVTMVTAITSKGKPKDMEIGLSDLGAKANFVGIMRDVTVRVKHEVPISMEVRLVHKPRPVIEEGEVHFSGSETLFESSLPGKSLDGRSVRLPRKVNMVLSLDDLQTWSGYANIDESDPLDNLNNILPPGVSAVERIAEGEKARDNKPLFAHGSGRSEGTTTHRSGAGSSRAAPVVTMNRGSVSTWNAPGGAEQSMMRQPVGSGLDKYMPAYTRESSVRSGSVLRAPKSSRIISEPSTFNVASAPPPAASQQPSVSTGSYMHGVPNPKP